MKMDKLIDGIERCTLEQVQNEELSEIRGRYSFDRNFVGFSGHFPGYPILPAVLQLLLAQLLIEKQKRCKVRITSIVRAKFLSEIRPEDEITVQCLDVSSDGDQKSKVRITSGERSISSFNINYTFEENMNC